MEFGSLFWKTLCDGVCWCSSPAGKVWCQVLLWSKAPSAGISSIPSFRAWIAFLTISKPSPHHLSSSNGKGTFEVVMMVRSLYKSCHGIFVIVDVLAISIGVECFAFRMSTKVFVFKFLGTRLCFALIQKVVAFLYNFFGCLNFSSFTPSFDIFCQGIHLSFGLNLLHNGCWGNGSSPLTSATSTSSDNIDQANHTPVIHLLRDQSHAWGPSHDKEPGIYD